MLDGTGDMKKVLYITALCLLILTNAAAVGVAVYFYREYKMAANTSVAPTDPQVYLKKLGKLMVLPDETPTIITVTDRDKLQSQAFFQKAENGDIVFVFENAHRVVLYRPSLDEIIDVAPLVYTTPAPTGALQATSSGFPLHVPVASASGAEKFASTSAILH